MSEDKLTLEEMAALLNPDGIDPVDLQALKDKHRETDEVLYKDLNGRAINPNGKRLIGKSFLTKHYQLFSTPYFRIYLQGVRDVDSLKEDDIEGFLRVATCAPIHYRGVYSNELKTFIDSTMESRSYYKFYTDKEFHKKWINTALGMGAILDTNKVANRARILQTIREYLTTLEAFLTAKGYDSCAHYLRKNSNGAITFKEGWENDL